MLPGFEIASQEGGAVKKKRRTKNPSEKLMRAPVTLEDQQNFWHYQAEQARINFALEKSPGITLTREEATYRYRTGRLILTENGEVYIPEAEETKFEDLFGVRYTKKCRNNSYKHIQKALIEGIEDFEVEEDKTEKREKNKDTIELSISDLENVFKLLLNIKEVKDAIETDEAAAGGNCRQPQRTE